MSDIEQLREKLSDLSKKMSETALSLSSVSVKLQSRQLLDNEEYSYAISRINDLSTIQAQFTDTLCQFAPDMTSPGSIDEANERISSIEETLSKADSFKLLSQIMSITGPDDDENLGLFKNSAAELCNQEISSEELRERMKPYAEFLNAVMNSDIRVATSKALRGKTHFSSDVLLNLVLGCYSIVEADNADNSEESELVPCTAVESGPDEHVTALNTESADECAETAELAEMEQDMMHDPENDISVSETAEIEVTNEPESNTAENERSPIEKEYAKIKNNMPSEKEHSLAAEIINAGFSYEIGDSFRYEFLRGDETIPANSKRVKKDLERYNSGNLETLIRMCGNIAVLPSAMNETTSFDFTPYLESLFESGYLDKLVPQGREPLYIISLKAKTCLSNISWFNKNVNMLLHKLVDHDIDYDVYDTCICAVNNAETIIGYAVMNSYVDSLYDNLNAKINSQESWSRLGLRIQRKAYTTILPEPTSYLLLSCSVPDERMTALLTRYLDETFAACTYKAVLISASSMKNCEILADYISAHYSDKTDLIFLYDICGDRFVSSGDTSTALSRKQFEEIVRGRTPDPDDSAVPDNMGSDSDIGEPEETDIPGTEAAVPYLEANEPASAMAAASDADAISEEQIADTVDTRATEAYEDSAEPIVTAEITVEPQEILSTVTRMIEKRRINCASAYLISLKNSGYASQLYNELAYAVNDPAGGCMYSSIDVMNAFNEFDPESELSQKLYLSAALRMLFYSYSRTDYHYNDLEIMVRSTAESLCPELSSLLYELSKFRKENGTGIDAYADYRLKNDLEIRENLNKIKARAKEIYSLHVENHITETIVHARFLDTKKMIFQHKNDLVVFLKCVVDDSSDMCGLASTFMYDNGFIEKNYEITSANIQKKAIGDYIDEFWYKAARTQRQKHISADLVSSARNNLIHGVQDVLEVIADWIKLSGLLGNSSSTEKFVKEKKIVSGLLANSCTKCELLLGQKNDAGLQCIYSTLCELRSRMEGSYREYSHNYYYADMLKYGKVMLDEQFLPDIQSYRNAVDGFTPTQRIIEQSELPERSFEDRIKEIFNISEGTSEEHLGDDYGCARRIKEYLEETQEYIWDESNDIEQNSAEAKRQLEDCRSRFVESLELAQSYGKITPEYKERLHLLESNEYATAIRTENFGFYNRFIAICVSSIDEKAHEQEEKLREALSRINTSSFDEDSSKKAADLVSQAEHLLEMKNFTVVEDIINRINREDLSDFDLGSSSTDTFSVYLREYEDCYAFVSNNGQQLKMMYSNPRNKDERAANNIIDNFPSSGRINEQRMNTLLTSLGFRCDKVVKTHDLIAKASCFDISVKKPHSNTKQSYRHPIAPFGSVAVSEGFRAVCLYGRFSADDLIAKFNELGETKNCIIFLDFALPLPEKRKLARKVKQEKFTKIFVVVDRVAARFLAKHYAESSINSDLMKITMPFSSYQPYVPNASQLPIEMFMGRKTQLNEIKSANGCNIVCGGRQLGKSALLNMAKNEIDHDENGSRAIFVSILNKNHTQAALALSYELISEGILPDGSSTDNWELLCMAIRKRLNDNSDRIPYLLIMMDEADEFIDSCKAVEYAPIAELEKIQQIGPGRFKFVVAGLHNLVRLEREIAERNNSVLARMKTLIIEPFNMLEARELLEVPLHYLGMRFPDDKAYLVSNILASTNYFPGLIHTYCEKLIKAMQKNDYAGYNSQCDPPYLITESHIKKVLADPDFTDEIRKKLMITLRLGNDNLYYVIAILLAYCHNSAPSADGFSAAQIYETGCEMEIRCFDDMNVKKIETLMDELCKLNVLTLNHTSQKYSFARFNFIQLLGKPTDIDNEILKFSEEVPNV